MACAGVLVACLLAAGCSRTASTADDVRVEWDVSPAPPVVGQATVDLRIVDEAGRPVSGATLRLEGHMTHPGMAPVPAPVREAAPGRYEASLPFSMAGDWVLLLSGELPDGRLLRERLDVSGVRSR